MEHPYTDYLLPDDSFAEGQRVPIAKKGINKGYGYAYIELPTKLADVPDDFDLPEGFRTARFFVEAVCVSGE